MKFLIATVALFGLLLSSQPSLAVNVTEIDAITGSVGTTLHGTTPTTNAIHVSAYYCNTSTPCTPDGGEGLMVKDTSGAHCKYAGGPGTGTLEDGGSFFADSSNNCWHRQNLSGDLRQWGITTGSPYDAANTAVGSLLPADTIVSNAITAFTAVGIKAIHTGQVSILLHSPLVLGTGWSLTCDTPRVLVPQTATALTMDFSNLPGSIVLGHQSASPGTLVAGLDAATNNNVEIHDCAAIIPEWYKNPSSAIATVFSGYSRLHAGPLSYTELEAIRANMVLAGDTAIAAGTGANIHDLTILGFDNCVNLNNGPGFIGRNLSLDCSIGMYLAKENGISSINNVFNIDYLTKGTTSMRQAAPFPNEEYWTVTSVAPDASGECELSLTAVQDGTTGLPKYSVAEFQNLVTATGGASGTNAAFGRADPNFYPAWVTGPQQVPSSCLSAGTGQFGNDAAWPMSVVVSMLHPDPTNYMNDKAVIDLVGSKYTTPSGGTPVGVTAHADWSANATVIHVTDSIANLAPGMTVTSTDPGFPAGTVTVAGIVQRCTGPDPNDGYAGCIVLSAPTTMATTTTAALTFYSAGLSSGHACDGTGQMPCLFLNAEERYVAGNSPAGIASTRLPGSRLGHLGAGFLLDSIAGLRSVNTDTYAHYYNIAAIDAAACDFVEFKGDDNGELNPGNTTGVYLAGASRGCVFENHGPGKPAGSIAQDTFGTSDNLTTPAPQTTSAFGTGANLTVTVSSTAGWPTRGTMHICQTVSSGACVLSGVGSTNEFAFYHVASSTTFVLDQRGRMGSFPQSFTGSGITLFSTSISSGSTKHTDKSAATVFSDIDASTTPVVGNQFEILHGSAAIRNVNTLSGGIGFVSTNSAGVTITASNQPNTSVVFEDEIARAGTTVTPDSTFATYIKPGVLLQPLSYGQYTGSPQALNVPTVGGTISATYLGDLNVQDTTNWPQTGVVQADSEYLAYHIDNTVTTAIIIDQRGLCGSTAASHAANTMASYMNVLWGCPLLTPSVPQFTMDGTGNVSFAQSDLAHGQVYMSLNGANIQLCPSGGKGLIISGVMRTIPSPCAVAPTSNAATANTLYYVYAVYHEVAVTSITANGGLPHIRLHVTDNTDFATGTPITCVGVTGQPGANVVEYNNTSTTIAGGPVIDLIGQTFVGTSSGTGACSYIGLEFDTNGHTTDQYGVEVDTATGGGAKTLVGMVATDSGSAINDSATKRDVASWFNRHGKTCRAVWASAGSYTTAGTGTPAWGELKDSGSNGLHCEFVSWAGNDVAWSLFGGGNSSLAQLTEMSGDFDAAATPEAEAVQWKTNNANDSPISTQGSATLTEGRHILSTYGLGAANSQTITTLIGSGEETRPQQ